MTVGVYGLVALIVKMDDAGFWLMRRPGTGPIVSVQRALGESLVSVAPGMMKLLGLLGTVAMFLVGGGIIVHGVPLLGGLSAQFQQYVLESAPLALLAPAAPVIFDALCGVLTGAVVLAFVLLGSRLFRAGGARS